MTKCGSICPVQPQCKLCQHHDKYSDGEKMSDIQIIPKPKLLASDTLTKKMSCIWVVRALVQEMLSRQQSN